MRRHLVIGITVAVVTVALVAPGAFAGGVSTQHLQASRTPQVPNLADRVAEVARYGRVITPSYLQQKALIDAQAGLNPAGAQGPTSPNDPVTFESFEGPFDPTLSPPDSQGAVGTTRFVNFINAKYTIWDRTVSPPTQLSTGTLFQFQGVTSQLLFDPYIIWDPGTKRFYYVFGDIISQNPENYQLAWGFSKSASPNSPSDWCHYVSDFGVYGTTADFPDYPKLGDTKDFLLIGVNVYPHLATFRGADVAWITKPPKGTTCPAQNSFTTGVEENLKQADASTAFTPVPANQIDDSHTGYIVANTDLGSPGDPGLPQVDSSKLITVLKVTKNLDGTANIQNPGQSFKVASYSMPPSAPQKGTVNTLDTLDGRLTNAQQAIDPTNGKAYLYTQQAVAGGAGAEVRWYKINPKKLTAKTHFISDSKLYVFDGVVSTDRLVKGSTTAFGDSVIAGFSTSSPTDFQAVQMVSLIGSGTQSGLVLVKQSATFDDDFTCPPVCRWGDYAAATPDPSADPGAAHGAVWLASTWVHSQFQIGTWNWAANP